MTQTITFKKSLPIVLKKNKIIDKLKEKISNCKMTQDIPKILRYRRTRSIRIRKRGYRRFIGRRVARIANIRRAMRSRILRSIYPDKRKARNYEKYTIKRVRKARKKLPKWVRREKIYEKTTKLPGQSHENSYYRQYLCVKRFNNQKRDASIRFERTVRFDDNFDQSFDYYRESAIFGSILGDIAWYEKNYFRARHLKSVRRHLNARLSRPLYKQDFTLGRIFITPRRRNIFITIEEITNDDGIIKNRVIYQTSGGIIGYQGPKKKTDFIRRLVVNDAVGCMANIGFTTIDIVFKCTTIRRRLRYIMKALVALPIYVRYILLGKRRAHGFTRGKKLKRK